MNEILTTDNIAIYGAIVATLAFLITVLQYLASIKDKKVQLSIGYKKHPDYDLNSQNIGIKYNPTTGDVSGTSGELYIVTIRNQGNVDAYINEIYGIAFDGVRYDTKVVTNKHGSCLIPIVEEYIQPKSSKDYSIYFQENSKSLKLKECFVVDGTGKKWKGKLL